MPAVSVVIPVYNTGPYLRRCLDSVCAQTLREIEILCVNDASPDNALAILREYAAKDSRIAVIDFSRNQGVSAARNAAVAIASGEYLGFVDSDDAIDRYFYEKLYVKAQETGAFIVKGVRQEIAEDGAIVETPLNEKIRCNKLSFTYQWQSAIYQTRFIRKNGIDFPLGACRNQDVAFLVKAVSMVPDVEVVDDVQYHYYRRENSSTARRFDCAATRSYLKSPEDIAAFLNSRPIDEKTYDHFFRYAIHLCLAGWPGKKPHSDAVDEVALLCAKAAIRLYAACLRPAVLHERLIARGQAEYIPSLAAADAAALAKIVKENPTGIIKRAIAESIRNRLKQALLSTAEKTLEHLEFHILDKCNLNCNGCFHFCPLIKQNAVYEPDIFIRDLQRMRDLFTTIGKICIMGGEPFLHPDWEFYARHTRKLFPESDVQIVTNGLLVPSLTKSQCDILRENRIKVQVSWYPETFRGRNKILATLRGGGVTTGTGRIKLNFRKPMSLKYSPEKWDYACPASHCVNIRDGKIARCAALMYIHHANDFFGLQLPNDGILDLHDDSLTYSSLVQALHEWPSLCKHCGSSITKWSRANSQDTIKLSDWFVDAEEEQ